MITIAGGILVALFVLWLAPLAVEWLLKPGAGQYVLAGSVVGVALFTYLSF